MSAGLSQRVRQLLSDPENSLYLSVASASEMTLKVQSGKLGLPTSVLPASTISEWKRFL